MKQIRDICTYHGDEGTSGYLLSEEQFSQIEKLLKPDKHLEQGGERFDGYVQTGDPQFPVGYKLTTSDPVEDDTSSHYHIVKTNKMMPPQDTWEEVFIKEFGIETSLNGSVDLFDFYENGGTFDKIKIFIRDLLHKEREEAKEIGYQNCLLDLQHEGKI